MGKRNREKRKQRQGGYSTPAERQERHSKGGFTPTAFKLPKGVELFKFSEAKRYYLDIMPYIVGDGNPMADKGIFHYERTYYTHTGFGANPRDKYCCSLKNFKKKCAFCDYTSKLRAEGEMEEEDIRKLEPKERQLWIVKDREEEGRPTRIMEAAHYGQGQGFGEMLDNKLEAADEDSPVQRFHHLEKGSTLVVKAKAAKFAGRGFFKPVNIEIVSREKGYPEKLINKMPCLDDLLIELSYKEQKRIIEASGGDPDDNDDDEEDDTMAKGKNGGKKAKGKNAEEEDEDDAADLEVGDSVTFKLKKKVMTGKIKKINAKKGTAEVAVGKGKPVTVELDDLKPADDEDDEDDDDEDEDDDDDEEEPTKKGKKKDEDDDDDEDEDDDDDDEDDDDDDEDDDDEEDDDDDDEEDDDDEDEDEKPKKGKK